MSYEQFEESSQDATPHLLISVTYTGQRWYYTTAGHDIEFEGIQYIAEPITPSEFVSAVQSSDTTYRLVFPEDVGFANLFINAPPSEPVTLTVLAKVDLQEIETVLVWKGRIRNLQFGKGKVTVFSEPLSASMKNRAGRMATSVTCPYAIYRDKCGVPKSAYRQDFVVTEVIGNNLVIQALVGGPTDFYENGLANWTNREYFNNESRDIRSFDPSTGTIELLGTPSGLIGGMTVSLYRGCDRTLDTCHNVFGNKDNTIALAYFPRKQMFGGTMLF